MQPTARFRSPTPVGRQYLHEPVDTLGDEEKTQVAAYADHLPRFGAPGVGLLDEEIRCEAGIDHLARRDFVTSVARAAHRQVESRCPAYLAAVLVVLRILPVDVAVPAAFAELAASVPRVPTDRHNLLFEFHAQAHHVAAFDAVCEKRNGVVFAEIVHVDAAADEPAAFVERNLARAQISCADFEKMEPGRPGRGDGVAEHGRGDALALVFGDDGDIDHFGRERPRVQEYILAEDFPVTTCDIGCAAAA